MENSYKLLVLYNNNNTKEICGNFICTATIALHVNAQNLARCGNWYA